MTFDCDGIIIGVKSKLIEQHAAKQSQSRQRKAPHRNNNKHLPHEIRSVASRQNTSKVLSLNLKHRKNPGRLIKSIQKLKNERNQEEGGRRRHLFETALQRIQGVRVVDDERVVKAAVKKHKAKIRSRKRKQRARAKEDVRKRSKNAGNTGKKQRQKKPEKRDRGKDELPKNQQKNRKSRFH